MRLFIWSWFLVLVRLWVGWFSLKSVNRGGGLGVRGFCPRVGPPPPRRFQNASIFQCFFDAFLHPFWEGFRAQVASQNPPKFKKIDAKMPSEVDFSFLSFFDRFSIPTCLPRSTKIFEKPAVFICFRVNRQSKLTSISDTISMPTCLHFPPKIHPNPIKNRSWQASIV